MLFNLLLPFAPCPNACDSDTDFNFFVPVGKPVRRVYWCRSMGVAFANKLAYYSLVEMEEGILLEARLVFYYRVRALYWCNKFEIELGLGLFFFARLAPKPFTFRSPCCYYYVSTYLRCLWTGGSSGAFILLAGIITLFKRSYVLNSRTRGFWTISPIPPSLQLVPIEPMEIMPELSPLCLLDPTLDYDPPLKFAGGVYTPPFAL